MTRILVTGAGGSAASNFIHSLRQSGERYHVVAADMRKFHLELVDAEEYKLIPPATDSAYLDEICAIVQNSSIDVIHAQPDAEAFELAMHREQLGARTLFPSMRTMEICRDKSQLAEAIADVGLPTPLTAVTSSPETLRKATDEIVDSRGRAWVRARRGAGSRASLPVVTGQQAVDWVEYWISMRGLAWSDFMVSEFLPGAEFAFQSLWRNGRLITSQARERVEYLYGHLTPSGQTSTPSIARTVHRDDVNELASAAIQAIDPNATGIFCADLKENHKGLPLITEINAGRFFTTSNFLTEAGVNMPHLYVKLALEEKIGPQREFNAVPADLYWVRMVDMGFKLVREGEWRAENG